MRLFVSHSCVIHASCILRIDGDRGFMGQLLARALAPCAHTCAHLLCAARQVVMIYMYTILAFNFFRDQWTMEVCPLALLVVSNHNILCVPASDSQVSLVPVFC